jgi:HSP20 family molecular chaperone IbpA
VRELNDAYYLDGELPGVDQSNIEIEFTDPQTLVVKGRTERNYSTSSASPQVETETETESRGQDTPSTSRTQSPSKHQPTVEDDDEDDEGNVSDARSTTSSASASSKHSTSSEAVIVQKPSAPAPAPATSSSSKDYYWVAERSIGEFQRTFAFATRVDQNGVRAALKNGILSIVVPKEAAPKTKKIRIN